MTLEQKIYDLYPLAYSLTKNRMDAQDLLQDLAERVFSNIEYYKEKPKTLMQVLRNIYTDNWRKKTKSGKFDVVEHESIYDNRVIENDVWGNMQKKELQTALLKLSKISETQAFCFRLKIDGYEPKEIKHMIKADTYRTSQFIFQAKKNLKKLIAACMLLFCLNASAQTYDTIPCFIPVFDSSSYILVYNKAGKQVKQVSPYQSYTIPIGGWIGQGDFINRQEYILKGRVVYFTHEKTKQTIIVKYLGINPPYLMSQPHHIFVNGYNHE